MGVAVTRDVNEEATLASEAFCKSRFEDGNNVVVVLEPDEGTTVINEVDVVFALVIFTTVADETKLAVPFNVISTPVNFRISAIALLPAIP